MSLAKIVVESKQPLPNTLSRQARHERSAFLTV
jgi:hypothetical protein